MVIQEHFLRWKWDTILLVHILSFFEKCTRGDWFACYWVQVQQEENHVLHFHKKCWSCRRRGEPYIRQDGKIRLMTTLVLETFPSILLRAIILTSIIKKYSLRSLKLEKCWLTHCTLMHAMHIGTTTITDILTKIY